MSRFIVITHPISKAGVIPLTHLIEILKEIPGGISLITGDEGWNAFREDDEINVQGIVTSRPTQPLKRVINFLRTQVWTSLAMIRVARGSEKVILLSGGDYLIAPILLSRILRKEVFLVLVGSSQKIMRSSSDSFTGVIGLLSSVAYKLSNEIIAYSKTSIEELGIKRFERKIAICHEHFIENPKSISPKNIYERSNTVIFVGRLVPEKGVMNLVKAIPTILKAESNLKVLICGDGILKDKISQYSEENLPRGALELAGWVEHDELPQIMSDTRLLVLPSFTEGLPNVMIEAMACGTPPLTTPVGSIPEIVVDGHNGFLMASNDPETIAYEVIRALHSKNLSEISQNGKAFVLSEFGFEKTLTLWRRVLNA